jgi:hypothetical protein
MLVGFIGGPILVWQGVDEHQLNHSVAHARLCPVGPRRSGCIVSVSGIAVAVIQPYPNAGPYGYASGDPGAGNVEPRIVLRLKGGRTVALDIGFRNIPAVGTRVTAYYYNGYLLRASRSADGKLIATTWTPQYWWLHALTGAALLCLAALALIHRVRKPHTLF